MIIAEKTRETNPAMIENLDKKRITLQSNHPGFSNEILCYDTKLDSWTVEGRLPFPTPVTTHAFLWDNRIFIPGGEIRAGVRTPDIFSAELPKK
jgi:N-acetylneuraminic acid mutarotase